MLEITSHDSKATEMFTAIDAAIDPQAPDIPRTLQILEEVGVTVPK
jgi:hypothetical protein